MALYVLVWQPAIVWWMIDNAQLYQLAWLNAWIFLIALIVSSLFKPAKDKKSDNTTKLVEKSETTVSKIENDNGVSIVEVEKKTEVVVEWLDADHKNESQQESESLEEKTAEKSADRPMKESVTIPKIVQPITWHSAAKKKRKREIRRGQRLVLLITLCLAAVIARTLREFLWVRWIAVSLFLWRLLYLVIGKLFDIDGFYNAKKLFTNWLYIVLILAWIGYGIYTTHQEDKSFNLLPIWWSDKVVDYAKNLFSSKENIEVNTWVIYVFEWTGEVIANTGDTEVVDNSWDEENTELEIWEGQEIENPEIENQLEPQNEVENQTNELSPQEAKKQVTMWEAVKSILAWVTLSTKTNSTFRYVSKSNELYPYFKTAQEKWMIWTDTDPSKIVSCETFITMKWLAEWWDVWSYVKSEIKSAYWKKAVELWKLNGCQKWNYVTKSNL